MGEDRRFFWWLADVVGVRLSAFGSCTSIHACEVEGRRRAVIHVAFCAFLGEVLKATRARAWRRFTSASETSGKTFETTCPGGEY